MSSDRPAGDFRTSRLWNRFLEALQKQRVEQRYFKWYTLRVEQFIQAHPELGPQHHSARELTLYLAEIGRTA